MCNSVEFFDGVSGLAVQAMTGEESLDAKPPRYNAVVVRAWFCGILHRYLVLACAPRCFIQETFSMVDFDMDGGVDHYVAGMFGMSAFKG